jgi:hypothetical protein
MHPISFTIFYRIRDVWIWLGSVVVEMDTNWFVWMILSGGIPSVHSKVHPLASYILSGARMILVLKRIWPTVPTAKYTYLTQPHPIYEINDGLTIRTDLLEKILTLPNIGIGAPKSSHPATIVP